MTGLPAAHDDSAYDRQGSYSSQSSDSSLTRRNSVAATPRYSRTASGPPSQGIGSPVTPAIAPPDWNPFWGEPGDAPSLTQAADRVVEEAQERLRKARQQNAVPGASPKST